MERTVHIDNDRLGIFHCAIPRKEGNGEKQDIEREKEKGIRNVKHGKVRHESKR